MNQPDWLHLRTLAEIFDDTQRYRIATFNRLGLKADGSPQDKGVDVDPDLYGAISEAALTAEKTAEKLLVQRYRKTVPAEIIKWQKASPGIGDKLTARLLGHLGDPLIATPKWWVEGKGDAKRELVTGDSYVRTLGQLWQFCGVGAPARRTKGMTQDEALSLGNPTIKKILFLHAQACVKANKGRYREIYDLHRMATADKLHTVECVRCGPSRKPAQPGTPWAPGHQHAHAMRMISKSILADLYDIRKAMEATALDPHHRREAQSTIGVGAPS